MAKLIRTEKALKMDMVRKKKKKGLSVFISENMILLIMPRVRYPRVSVRPEERADMCDFFLSSILT